MIGAAPVRLSKLPVSLLPHDETKRLVYKGLERILSLS